MSVFSQFFELLKEINWLKNFVKKVFSVFAATYCICEK
jgi:hypothetical protein